MTGFDAIEKVKTELDNAGLSLSGGVYQFSKPLDADDDEFVEINCLTLPETILQQANVNVNIFVKDIRVGTPNNKRLKELLTEIISILPISISDENIHVFPSSTDIIPDIDNSRHYVNLRLQVMMLNN